MTLAVMAIGLPGSGKTTLLKPLAAQHGFTYISRDDIRHELLGHPLEQSRNKEVWEEANRRTADALKLGTGVLLDSCFAEKWKRIEAVRFLKANGADRVVGIYIDVPLEVAKERNKGRTYTVKESVIDWMYAKLERDPPSLEEGFDALYTAREFETFTKTEFAAP